MIQLNVEMIEKMLIDRKITTFQLAQELGVAYATLKGHFISKTSIRLSLINRLADYFSVSPNVLIKII